MTKRLTCAIYTRKSSDDGLEQEFNSLDAQREACAAFILSQKHAGWVATPGSYDDGGLSGGTMARPALQRLIDDVTSRRVQIIVVYKVDRLTRSLADFAKIVDVLDAHGASFVSVTQQFNTTTSMGRLTLNMLLSFAQFEREIAGERIRDKIAASKARGMWMGGAVPLGYDVKDRQLIVNKSEAEQVQTIFRQYLDTDSVRSLAIALADQGLVSKRREGADGPTGGSPFARGALYRLLQNPIYRGQIAHKGAVYPGRHEPIVEQGLWDSIQAKLANNRQDRTLASFTGGGSLLTGVIEDSDGQRMTPSHANKKGRRYRYYVSAGLVTGARADHRSGLRVPAGELEGLVVDRVQALLASDEELGGLLAAVLVHAADLQAALLKARQFSAGWTALPPAEVHALLRVLVRRVRVSNSSIAIDLDVSTMAAVLLGGTGARATETESATTELTIETHLRRAGKGVRLIIGGSLGHATDENVTHLLRQAFLARDALRSGQDASMDDLAGRLQIRRDKLTALLRLTQLAPDIIRDLLAGQAPIGLTSPRLLAIGKSLPYTWTAQRSYLCLTPRAK